MRRAAATVLEFTEIMGLLSESGLSLKDALEVARSMESDGPLRDLSERILAPIRRGRSFAQAVAAAEDAFPPMYRGMIAIGDRVGSVERIFPPLAAYLRQRKALREKTAGALAYPLLVLAVSLVGILAVVVFVVPRLEIIFAGFGGAAGERLKGNVRTMNAILLSAAFLGLAALGAAAILRLARARSTAAAAFLDRLVLRLPVAGSFAAALETLNFSFAMETLVAGGVPIEAAMEEASAVAENAAFRSAVLDARRDVLQGVPLSVAFGEREELPAYVSRWIAVGERSGQSVRVFAQIRAYFQGEVDRGMQRFMALVEPALIAAVGTVVLLIVLLLIVPLFSMFGSIL